MPIIRIAKDVMKRLRRPTNLPVQQDALSVT
jgi:hypothetical protein